MSDRIALVTGAHGSIGRQVAATLAVRGWQVTGIGRGRWTPDQAAEHGVSTWICGDITIESLLALAPRPACIVHCAGSGSVGPSLTRPYEDWQRNVGTLASVLEWMRTTCPEAALVLPSSAAVYGVADRWPTPEIAPSHPLSPYGLHKKIAEELAGGYAREFHLRISIVRLFSIYGEGFRKQLLWDACRRVAAGSFEFSGTGEETRDWLHVSDAASLLVMAAQWADPGCPVVNGASGVPVTVRDVLEELMRAMACAGRPRFNGVQRAGDPSRYHADIGKALQSGWRPAVAWRTGVARYGRWFLDQAESS